MFILNRGLAAITLAATLLTGCGGGGGSSGATGGTGTGTSAGTSITCNTAHYVAGAVSVPTAGDMATYAKTYNGNTGTFGMSGFASDGGTATFVLGSDGALSYNSAAQTVNSICKDNTLAMIYVEFGSTGSVDFFADGTFTGNLPNLTGVHSTVSAGATSPAVSGFTPATGTVGTTVTISGTNLGNFTPAPVVKFGTTTATVSSATATSIVLTVPAGLAAGNSTITLSNFDGTGVVSVGTFNVTASGGGGGGGGIAAWTASGGLTTAHYQSSTTLLANDKVLVAGGSFNATAERYDLATGLWSSAGNLAQERSGHDATLLADGKVLITGGSVTAGASTATTERYDPVTNLWSATGSFAATRRYHSTLRLADGKVLAVGGMVGGTWSASAELYDPATGLWSATGSLSAPRSSHTITLLANGKVLVAGGLNPFGGTLPSAELYDPATGLWTLTGEWSVTANLLRVRYGHTATLTADGKVLVAGGSANAGVGLALTELYDPATNQWTPQGAVPVAGRRTNHTATLLSDGKVLLAGGQMGGGRVAIANLYDPATGLWTETGGNMLTNSRLNHIAILLPNGKVLVTGGTSFIGVSGFPDQLSSAVVYDPATALWTTVGNFNSVSKVGSATLLSNGNVLAIADGASNLDVGSELYY